MNRLYKSSVFAQWVDSNLGKASTASFPTRSDAVSILVYLIKYGIPATIEASLVEAVLGTEGPYGWRKRPEHRWDDDKCLSSEGSVRSALSSWLTYIRGEYSVPSKTDRESLLTVVEQFANAISMIMSATCLPTESSASTWRIASTRLGCVWDDDDLADIDYQMREAEDAEGEVLQSSVLDEATEWLYPVVSTMAAAGHPRIMHMGHSGGSFSLDDAELMMTITNARRSRKNILRLRSLINSPEFLDGLWVNSKSSETRAIRELLSHPEVVPEVMETSLLILMMEFGVPNNWELFSKILGQVLGFEHGKSITKMGISTVRSTSIGDIVRRIREIDAAFDGRRPPDAKNIRLQLSDVFAGSHRDQVNSALQKLGSRFLADHLLWMATLVEQTLVPASTNSHATSGAASVGSSFDSTKEEAKPEPKPEPQPEPAPVKKRRKRDT